MKLRALGDRIILKDYIPRETHGIILPEKLRGRYQFSNARWGTVLATGPKCRDVQIGDTVLSYYEQAQSFPEAPGVFSVPFHAVLAKTEKD